MTNDRQLKANRANSAKSTGPRSTGGKKRAGKNAYRHGLSLSIDLTANAKQVENLARKIAGGSGSKIVWDHAINAAQAQLDLARVQRVKIALIERVLARGTVDAANTAVSASKLVQRLKRILAGRDVSQNQLIRSPPCQPRSRSDRQRHCEGRFQNCSS